MKNGTLSARILKFVAVAAITATATLATAQEVKVGVVHIERILRDSAPAKAVQQKLEQEFSQRDKDLREIAGRLQSMGERLERDATVMSDRDRQSKQREYADVEKDFQRKQREFREDLNQRRNEEIAQVIDKANRAIKQIAEQEKYDLILQDAVYASPRTDITEKVLRALSTGGK
jgi:outer membrane protein